MRYLLVFPELLSYVTISTFFMKNILTSSFIEINNFGYIEMLWKIVLLQINNLSFTRFSTLCFNFCSIFSFELRLYYHKQIFIHSHLTHSFTSLSEEVFFLESDIPCAVFITFTFSINFFSLSFICNDLSHDEQI